MRIVLIFSLVLSSLLWGGMSSDKVDYDIGFKGISSEEILRTIANETSKSVPIRLDAATEVTRIFAIRNTLHYLKEIDTNYESFEGNWASLRDTLHKEMFKSDSQVACNIDVINYLIMKRGVKIYYRYVDLKQKELFTHSVEKTDCENLKQNIVR